MNTVRGRRFFQFRIVQHLVILALCVLLPQLLLGAFVAWRYSNDQRLAIERGAVSRASDRRASLDRELEGMIGSLQALALSPFIDEKNFGAFQDQAKQIVRLRGTAIAMRDRTGQQIVDTVAPFGTPLPVSKDPDLLATDAKIFRTKEPAVSDLYIGAITKRPFVMVGVPVIRNDEVLYVLQTGIDPLDLGQALFRDIPKDWVASIVDRKMRVITRSLDPQRFVGQLGTQAFRDNVRGDSGSFYGGMTLDGIRVFTAYQRSPLSGWVISFAVPEQVLALPLRDLWFALVTMGLVAALISIAAAATYGRMIGRGLSSLALSARKVGRDHFVASPHSPILEIDEVADILQQTDTELKRKDQHQRMLLHELDHRVKNTLAIITSLVTQSLRGSTSPQHFRDAITGRVMALARSHEVLSAANWEDPELAHVADCVLSHESGRVQWTGIRVKLTPRVVVAMAQCFHELLTNAERHGALSKPDGKVNVIWGLSEQPDELVLTWIESAPGGGRVEGIDGLGTRIIRICIERQLGGSCSFDYLDSGLRFEARIPLVSELGANGSVMAAE